MAAWFKHTLLRYKLHLRSSKDKVMKQNINLSCNNRTEQSEHNFIQLI